MKVEKLHGYFPVALDPRPCPICGLAGVHNFGEGNGDRYEGDESQLTTLDPNLSGDERAVDSPLNLEDDHV